jgi:signal transduction histidine kinase
VRLTIRARLTVVYGGLFLVAGIALLAITYLLVAARVTGGASVSIEGSGSPPASETPASFSHVIDDTWADALSALLAGGGVALAMVGALAVAVGWLLAGRLLRPLHRVTETARRIAESPTRNLHERISLAAPDDELKDLADAFDVMIERLHRSFDSQRRFIANASHELRTPLAVTRALIEVAVLQRPEVRDVGASLLDVSARHERLIDGLLLLARSEHEVTDRSYVDLADILVDTVERVGSTVRTRVEAAPTSGNAALLERLVHNLVDNAIRYNIDGGWVRATSGTLGDSAVLEVRNTGPVVPGYEVSGLFEPFRRYPRDRPAGGTAGAGLGLSIVRAIATAHGGEVRAEPNPGGGLVVTVVLPGRLT